MLANFMSTWYKLESFRKREPQLRKPTRLTSGAFSPLTIDVGKPSLCGQRYLWAGDLDAVRKQAQQSVREQASELWSPRSFHQFLSAGSCFEFPQDQTLRGDFTGCPLISTHASVHAHSPMQRRHQRNREKVLQTAETDNDLLLLHSVLDIEKTALY